MNKPRFYTLIAFIIAALVGTGATFAYIVASSHDVINTFTVGNVEISLNESTTNEFPLIPGATYTKDPTVTVKAESLDCYLFIKVTPTADLHLYVDYKIDEGWTAVAGEAGVYYRKVFTAKSDSSFRILKDDTITIYENLDEETLSLIKINPTLKFKAYAIQSDIINSPESAWNAIIAEKGE